MDNKNESPSPIITDELKKEAAESIGQAKDIIKNVNIKEEAENTKGFLLTMWKNPIKETKSVAVNSKEYFKISVILLCIWTISDFISETVYFVKYFNNFYGSIVDNIISIVTGTISPLAMVLVLSAAVYVLHRDKSKSITSVIVTVTIASFPRVIGAVLSILSSLVSSASSIISPIVSFLSALSIIMVYFGLKALLEEEDDESFFKRFIFIQAVYFLAKFILGYFQIYI